MIDILNSDSDSSDFISSTKIVVSDLKRYISYANKFFFSFFYDHNFWITSNIGRILSVFGDSESESAK